MTTECWINGVADDLVPASDRGIQYGDGLFENLPVKDGRIALLDSHLDRLLTGCDRIELHAPPKEQLLTELHTAANGQTAAILKLIITRGQAGYGYHYPKPAQTCRILMRFPWVTYPREYAENGVRARICDTHLGHNRKLAGLKHLNRLEQILARAEWSEVDQVQEGLMLDEEGSVIEGTMSNVFAWLEHGVLATPDLRRCGVAGVMRRYLLERAQHAGIGVRVASLSLSELMRAKEIFICNSVIGVWPVAAIGHWKYPVGNITRQMQNWSLEC